MTSPHRIRRLRWQARATTPADAFALRTLLRVRGDEVHAAFDRALEGMTVGDEVLQLGRLELRLDAGSLAALADSFEEQVEAAAHESVRAAVLQARAAMGRTAPGVKGDVTQRSASSARRDSLRHYLRTGSFDWTLAGLAPDVAAAALQRAASDAATAGDAAEFESMLGTAGPAAQRIGALLRWLRLLSPAQRSAWVARVTPQGDSPRVTDALTALRASLDADAADLDEHQAIWLAWPRSAAAAQRAHWYRGVVEWSGASKPRAAKATQALVDALNAELGATPATRVSITPTGPEPARNDLRAEIDATDTDTDTDSAMLVPMAGLVLVHPYLPRLLEACGLHTPGERSLRADALAPACSLLHWLGCGRDETPEFDLPLIKLLLGTAPDAPLTVAPVAPRDADRVEAIALLDSVRMHWSALRGTGNDGLRMSFLQRRGLLGRRDGAWHLRMQGEAFDMLLAMLPWSIGLIRLPWVPLPLVVEWDTP